MAEIRMTPGQTSRLDQNLAATDDDLNELVAVYRASPAADGPVGALVDVSQAVLDAHMTRSDLVRLLARAVQRLAGDS